MNAKRSYFTPIEIITNGTGGHHPSEPVQARFTCSRSRFSHNKIVTLQLTNAACNNKICFQLGNGLLACSISLASVCTCADNHRPQRQLSTVVDETTGPPVLDSDTYKSRPGKLRKCFPSSV